MLAVLISQSVSAGEWRITPALELGETFTDNIELAPPGEEEWDLITQINPRLSVHGDGWRLKLDFDYRMQNLFFLKEPETNGINYQLQAVGNAELIENLFFVDAESSIGQAVISAEAGIPVSTVTGAGNLTDVATFSISPYLRTEGDQHSPTARVSRAPPYACQDRADGVSRGPGRWECLLATAPRLPGDVGSDGLSKGRVHRFRGDPGRDDRTGDTLSHPAGEYRAACDGGGGHQYRGGDRPSMHSASNSRPNLALSK